MAPARGLWMIFAASTAVKVLLLAGQGYHSTDFEVHRNWLAVTSSLPASQWYFDETSQWTLDYPPFFAWFEWGLAQVARRVDPLMLEVRELPYASWETVCFQRVSVMAVDLLLLLGVAACFQSTKGKPKTALSAAYPGRETKLACAGVLVLLNAGLLMVDHMHFQYNGMLLGTLLLSVGLLKQERNVAGAFVFAALLMCKHLFLTLAPLYFVYLLRAYCLSGPEPGKGPSLSSFLGRLAALGGTVLGVFGLAVFPFCWGGSSSSCALQLSQMLSRLFPFGRGLVHAYWAPNAWALYLFLDRLGLAVWRRLDPAGAARSSASSFSSTTGGLVHDAGTTLLPDIRPLLTVGLTLLACCPALVSVWRQPRPRTFLWGVVHCALSGFIFGWHVHEKAVLVALVPLAVLACEDRRASTLYLRSSAVGLYALFPLLPGPWETGIKLFLWAGNLLAARWLLRGVWGGDGGGVSSQEGLRAVGLLALFLCAEGLHPLLSSSFGDRLPFLPLMATSVVCGAALCLDWACCLRLVWREGQGEGHCGGAVKPALRKAKRA